jgi:membrane associated rhomboid family serine protease
MQRTPPIVLNLIIINVLVWIAQLVLDKTIGFTDLIALYPIGSEFRPYQLVTYMFAHASYDGVGNIHFFHILFNMYALWMFGSALEQYWGAKKFLIFYFACGLAAGVTHLVLSNNPVVGASGAVMGLLAAFAYLFPNTEFFIIPIPFPIKAKYMAAIYAAIDLFGGFQPGKGDDIAHFAHLGGLAMGFILVIIWKRNQRRTFF